MSRATVEVNAEVLEQAMSIKGSDGTPLFRSAGDAFVSYVLAFAPRSNFWVSRVRIVNLQGEEENE